MSADTQRNVEQQEVAIVGIGCLFPGAKDVTEYWDLLIGERTGIVEVNDHDLGKPISAYLDCAKGTKDKICSARKGIVRDFAFDSAGFRIAPEILNRLDDLFKWTLYSCRQALEDARCYPEHRLLPRTGIILGNVVFESKRLFDSIEPLYADIVAEALKESGHAIQAPGPGPEERTEPDPIGIIFSYPAVVAAKALALGGPCFALDAACASSLYSIKLACDCLRAGHADMMLAGGSCQSANMIDSIVFNNLGVMDGSRPNRPLDRGSEGIVSGEGSGIVVLKRLPDAVRDGDTIYAVIEGVGVANDGGEKHLLAPAQTGQLASYERAYGNGKVPCNVDYVECHATGTKVGDQVELNSMEKFFGSAGIRPRFGAVKGNVGHLLSAAGVAGLIKVLLSLKHNEIPATVGVTNPLSSDGGLFGAENIVAKRLPWPSRGKVRRAGVNAFGFGGTDAHLVLRDRIGIEPQPCAPEPLVRVGITGMGARFGNLADVREFRNAIYHGRADLAPRPEGRWLGLERKRELLAKYGLDCGNAQQGSFIDGIELDFLKHKISPADNPVALMRNIVMLNVADQALTDAGLVKGKDRKVAVIIGTEYEVSTNRFCARTELRARFSAVPGLWEELEESLKDRICPDTSAQSVLSRVANIVASRISADWGFNGPSFVMGAMENTVPKILQVAQRMLTFDGIEAVLVGAIDLQGEFENVLLYNQLHPGERRFVIGEGAGAVVVRRMDDIVRSREKCYAQIEAISVRESAKPSVASGIDTVAIRECADEALRASSVAPSAVGYVELSGGAGGADAGAEQDALAGVYDAGERSPRVGNVKHNVGANVVASGMAGLLKAALCLRGRFLPAEPASPISAARDSSPWERCGARRYAAVNTLGFDGACAHVVLAEPDPVLRPTGGHLGNFENRLFVAAGRDRDGLLLDLRELKRELDSGAEPGWVAADRYRRYGDMKGADRLLVTVIVGKDTAEILNAADRAIREVPRCIDSGRNWSMKNGSCCVVNSMRGKGSLAFVFPLGGVNGYGAIGKYLYLFPESMSVLDDYDERYPGRRKFFDPRAGAAPSAVNGDSVIVSGNAAGSGDHPMIRQQIIGQLNTRILRDCFGITPDVVFGCSFGELAFMTTFRLFSDSANDASEYMVNLVEKNLACLQDATRISEYYGQSGEVEWENYFVRGDIEKLRRAVEGEEQVFLSIICSPYEGFLCGAPDVCMRLMKEHDALFYRSYQTYVHTPLADRLMPDIYRDIAARRFSFPDGHAIETYYSYDRQKHRLSAEVMNRALEACITKQVDFPSLVRKTYDDGARVYIDIGPQDHCARWVHDTLGDAEHLSLAISGKDEVGETEILTLLAWMTSARLDPDISRLFDDRLLANTEKSFVKRIAFRYRDAFGGLPSGAVDKPRIDTRLTGVEVNRLPADESVAAARVADVPVSAATVAAVPVSAIPKPAVVPTGGIANPASSPSDEGGGRQQGVLGRSAATELARIQQVYLSLQAAFCERLLAVASAAANALTPNPAFALGFAPAAGLVSARAPAVAPAVLRGPARLLKPSAATAPAVLHALPPTPERAARPLVWNEQQILEMTEGRISAVLGPEYAEVDEHPVRARIPSPPFMFVSRVTKMTAKKNCYEPCLLEMEYDTDRNAWYVFNGNVIDLVAYESSHALILMLAHIGVDKEFNFRLRYRVTDAETAFFDDYALRAGDTLRTIVRITSFIKTADKLIVFYENECYFGDVLLFRSMCTGGMFSESDLASSRGIANIPSRQRATCRKDPVGPPKGGGSGVVVAPVCNKRSFADSDLRELKRGRPERCFGLGYTNYSGAARMLCNDAQDMLDRITRIDLTGGNYDAGLVIGEKDITPDHWAFRAHFKNDPVLPGNLMVEGANQLLQFFMHFMGFHYRDERNDWIGRPLKGNTERCSFRGQVPRGASTLRYVLHVREIDANRQASVIGDIEAFVGEKRIMTISNYSSSLHRRAVSGG